MSQDNLKLTEATFDAVCAALDERRWFYEKDAERFRLNCKANGEDLFMEVEVSCDQDKQIVTLLSRLPFVVTESRRRDMAVVLARINNALGEGVFDYHYKRGIICFRMTSSYRGSTVSASAFDRMIMLSFSTVEYYNDKLLLFSLGKLTMDEFCREIIT